MAIFVAVGAAHGATVRVRCPHCGKVQVRARDRPRYRCNACHRSFEAAAGKTEVEPKGPSGKRRQR